MKHIDQLMSNRLTDQLLIAFANVQPWLDLPGLRKIQIAAGTGSHEFGEASSTIMLANMIRQARPDLEVKLVFHGLAWDKELNGFVDFSHHGPNQGIRVWTKDGVARLSLRSLMLDEIIHGREVPKLYLRGHIHMPIDIEENYGQHRARLVVVPSLCGMSVYARQVTKSSYMLHNGGFVDGQLISHSLDLRTVDDDDRFTGSGSDRASRDTQESPARWARDWWRRHRSGAAGADA
jgi:hypothetical protein